MSSQTRASGGGGRQTKKTSSGGDTMANNNTNHKKTDHGKADKEKNHSKPTADQIRIAQITEVKSGSDDPKMREKVAKLMETTQRSEEDVCCALYECDNDLDRAVMFLLETLPVGAFETSSKKKKKAAAAAASGSAVAAADEWGTDALSGGNAGGGNVHDGRDRSRNHNSVRGGRGGSDSRGWRGRESRENDRNAANSRGGDRAYGGGGSVGGGGGGGDWATSERWQGGARGVGRGGFRGTGRGGGRGGTRLGPRSSSNREPNRDRDSFFRPEETAQEVDTWDNAIASSSEIKSNVSADNWGDWDNEEYTGSLADTKVFTPSFASQAAAGIASETAANATDLTAPPGLEQTVLNPPAEEAIQQYTTTVSSSTTTAGAVAAVTNNTLNNSPTTLNVSASSNLVQYQENATAVSSAAVATSSVPSLLRQTTVELPQPHSAASLSAEQSLYFKTLTSQNSTQQIPPPTTASAHPQVVTQVPVQQQQQQAVSQHQQAVLSAYQVPVSVQYPVAAGYVTGSIYGEVTTSVQTPQTRKQRARVPPPSKIPSTAVEMPGDSSLNNIGFLDVQFGGLDFGTDDSFDTISGDKFNSNPQDNAPNAATPVDASAGGDYTQSSGGSVTKPQQQQPQPSQLAQQPHQLQNTAGLVSSSLQSSPILPTADSLSTPNESLSAAFNQRSVTNSGVQQQIATNSVSINNNAALDQLSKTDHYNNSSSVNPSTGSAYQHQSFTNNANAANNSNTVKATTGYPTSNNTPQGYSNSNYSNPQVSNSGNSYPTASSNSFGTYNNQSNAYQPQSNASSGVSGSVNTGVPSGISTGNSSVANNPNNNNNSANTNSGYLSNPYPSSQTASTYPSQPQNNVYQNSQSVYGSTGYANSTSNTSSAQYSNFSTTKLSKETTPVTTIYDSPSSGVNNVISSNSVNNGANNNTSSSSAASSIAPSNNAPVNSSLSSPSALNLTNVSKVTTNAAAAAKNSSNSGSSSGGGVVPNIPMVSQYIQAGMPFYQQPVYSYEDIQIMQQRMPHVQPGYYDMNYQTPTSLGAGGVREANLGSVAYSAMSDGRFARTDNNSSPVSNVPSTMSQQTGSGGPMLNLPYAYFYGGNMMPAGSFQYSTPAIYPQQQMPATNASSGGQFPKPSYNSGYGSTGYDTLSQSTQDYNKGGYPGTSVGQQQTSKGQNVSNAPPSGTGTDISTSMYGKSHVALNKVNSYEKQSYHSGTPPPFNIAGTQNAGAATGQAYGGQQLYITHTMPTAHHNMNMHQPIHQMDGRIHSTAWRESNNTNQRQQSSTQGKTGAKPGYSPSYWTAQN